MLCCLYLDPVLWSYPAEVQTFTMRSKGLLLWNQINQLCGAYTTWVDSIALGKIGECTVVTLAKNFDLRGTNVCIRLQIRCRLHPSCRHPMGTSLQVSVFTASVLEAVSFES